VRWGPVSPATSSASHALSSRRAFSTSLSSHRVSLAVFAPCCPQALALGWARDGVLHCESGSCRVLTGWLGHRWWFACWQDASSNTVTCEVLWDATFSSTGLAFIWIYGKKRFLKQLKWLRGWLCELVMSSVLETGRLWTVLYQQYNLVTPANQPQRIWSVSYRWDEFSDVYHEVINLYLWCSLTFWRAVRVFLLCSYPLEKSKQKTVNTLNMSRHQQN